MMDWRITVVRTSLERLGYKIIYPYLSIYIIALGATKSQLGLITSIGMLISGIVGPITGRWLDRTGAKKIYMLGIVLLLCSYLLYFSAPSWYLCVAAMIIYYLGASTSGHSCATICGNCLKNEDRARGMLICESFAAGLLGMLGPVIASWLLVHVIGVSEEKASASQLKYLFLVSAFFTLVSLLVVIFKLSNERIIQTETSKKGNGFAAGVEILKKNKNARKWLLISAVGALPQAMIMPYVQVFASDKGAGVTLLAGMVTAQALTSTFLGYPVGVIADKIGRKKVLFVLIPLYWLANILLIVTQANWLLIVVGFLLGLYEITSPLAGAVQRELVPNEVMGTWIGITRFFNAFVNAIMAFTSGVIYDKIGPAYMFSLFIAIDLIVRVPLLATLPETLHHKVVVDEDGTVH